MSLQAGAEIWLAVLPTQRRPTGPAGTGGGGGGDPDRRYEKGEVGAEWGGAGGVKSKR